MATLTKTQLSRAKTLYVEQGRSPQYVATALNAEFEGLDVTARQITEVQAHRGWSAQRKDAALKRVDLDLAAAATVDVASAIPRGIADHKEFLAASANVGATALIKARKMLETSQSPRDLASTINAASRAIEVYRRACGLDAAALGSPVPGAVVNNFFNFAHSPESPFSSKFREARAKKAAETTPQDSDFCPDEVIANTSGSILEPEESQ